MTRDLVLAPAELADPRLALDDQALTVASRNAYPIVAGRTARRDHAGLLAGGSIALLLGLGTFWTMSGGRERPSLRTAEPAPIEAAAPRLATTVMPSKPVAAPPAAFPQSSSPAEPAPRPAPAPVMVFDASVAPASPPPASPQGAAAGPARTAPVQGMSENESFAARLVDSGVETASATRLADPANTITQGTLIAAILETAIDSDLPGYVRAVVSQDVRSFDGSRVLIPSSSRLIGQYKSGLAAGQTRAYVLWTRLIRPDGVSIAIGSPATDFSGRSGLAGDVDGHFGKRFGSAILLSAVGGLGAIASGGTSLILAGGQSAASVAAQRDAQIPPTVRIRQGQPIRIFTARDLDFSTIAEEPVS
jgi:type IV secretion system protein VirB10